MQNPLVCLPVVQQAAIAAYALRGCGDKEAGDAAAVEAMHHAFASLPFSVQVVVGEGEKDTAPMLYVGEVLGRDVAPTYEIAVDPLEGTRLLANNQLGAVTTLAVAPLGSLYAPKESFYMEKIVVPPVAAGVVDPNAPIESIVCEVAKALGKTLQECTVFVLDKPRHASLIQKLHTLGVRVLLRTDGDVAGSLLALGVQSNTSCDVDMMLGIGGTPEGVLTACAVRAVGGGFFARFAPQSTKEEEKLSKLGIAMDIWHDTSYFVRSDDIYFYVTGVTDGCLLSGISVVSKKYRTHSLLFDGIAKKVYSITELLS